MLRTTGIKVVQDLWSNGISAELAVDASSLEDLLSKYRDHNHSWIVIAKQDSKERGFKVRSLAPREEYDMRALELVPWLRNEIRVRNLREGTTDHSKQHRLPSQPDLSSPGNERTNDVRILVSQHRSKKSNRRNIVDSGMLCSELYVQLTGHLNNGKQLFNVHAKLSNKPSMAPSLLLILEMTSLSPSATRVFQTLTAGAQ